MTSTAFANAGYVAVAAIVGLLAAEILGNDRLAGLPAAAATLGTAVEFSQHHSAERQNFIELAGLVERVLAGVGIQHQQNLMRG